MSSPRAEGSPISPLLADLWRRSQPPQAELGQAYARYQRRSTAGRRPSVRHVVVWMGAGMLIGMGSLYAAEAVHDRWHHSQPLSHPAASQAPVFVAPQRPAAPGSIESGPVPSPSAQVAPPAASNSGTATAEMPSPESWQRAARGLRESDFDAANDALLKLSRQGSQAERDIAKLVRAQVLLRQQRSEEAKVLLLELASSAASATAREKSARLLDQLSTAAPSHRSFAIDAGTDSP